MRGSTASSQSLLRRKRFLVGYRITNKCLLENVTVTQVLKQFPISNADGHISGPRPSFSTGLSVCTSTQCALQHIKNSASCVWVTHLQPVVGLTLPNLRVTRSLLDEISHAMSSSAHDTDFRVSSSHTHTSHPKPRVHRKVDFTFEVISEIASPQSAMALKRPTGQLQQDTLLQGQVILQ